MKYYICPKCKSKTTISEKKSIVREGDSSYSQENVVQMDCCGFVPFILPEPIKDEQDGNNNP